MLLKKVCEMLFGVDSQDFVYSTTHFGRKNSVQFVYMKNELHSLRLFKWFAVLNLKYGDQFGHGYLEQENTFYFWIKD